MAYKQQILLKHKHGITAQWISEDFSWIAVATYQQNEIKIKANLFYIFYRKNSI